MSHTLGPWELLDGRNIKTVNGIFFLSYGCDEHSKKPFFFSKENGWSELDANAKLTAAAPELLEALKALVSTARTFSDCVPDKDKMWTSLDEDALTAALNAIAKATGEQR